MRLNGLKFPQDILRAFQEMLGEVKKIENDIAGNLPNVGDDASLQLDKIKRKLIELVGHFVKNVSFSLPTYEKEDEEKVKFIALAFLDEKFIHMDWSLSDYWSENPLEKDSFGTRNAGTVVFDRIDVLSDERLIDRYYALLYYLVLSCGFAGKYDADKDIKVLTQYKSTLKRTVEKAFSTSEVALRANSQEVRLASINLEKTFLPTRRKFNVMAVLFILVSLTLVQGFWYFKSMPILEMSEQIVRMGF